MDVLFTHIRLTYHSRCWAFSFISALESHWFIAHGQSVDLPEQFVNDCTWSDDVNACDGGESGVAGMEIIRKFGGRVPTREEYGGYLSVDGGCYIDILQDIGIMDGSQNNQLSMTPSSTVQLTDWVVLPERDEIATKHALFTKGPLSVALNVVDEALYYASGVLDVASCVTEDVDHAVTLVGWGVDVLPDGSKAEHWILRNSWSDLWGDSVSYFVFNELLVAPLFSSQLIHISLGLFQGENGRKRLWSYKLCGISEGNGYTRKSEELGRAIRNSCSKLVNDLMEWTIVKWSIYFSLAVQTSCIY